MPADPGGGAGAGITLPTYSDTATAYVGLASRGQETLAALDALRAGVGLQTTVTDVQTLGGGGVVYADPVSVRLGFGAQQVGRAFFADTVSANVGLVSSLTETYTASFPQWYPELGRAKAGVNSSCVDVSACVDVVSVSLELNALQMGAFGAREALATKLAVLPFQTDGKTWQEGAVGAKSGFQASAAEAWNTHDSATAQVGASATAVDSFPMRETPSAGVGMGAQVTVVYTLQEQTSGRSGTCAGVQDAFHAQEFPAAKWGIKAACVDVLASREVMSVNMGAGACCAPAKVSTEVSLAWLGVTASVSEVVRYGEA